MIRAGIGRRQEKEDEIDRHIVDRLELDGCGKPREITENLRQALDLAMRYGDARSESGGSPRQLHRGYGGVGANCQGR